MMKKIILLLVLHISIRSFSQVLYSESFNTLSLNTATYTSGSSTYTYLYNDVPSGMVMINNGNLTADTLTGNYPFRKAGQQQKAWLVYKQAVIADTFAVSTSWLKPQGTADAWLVTPVINNIASNTVFTWQAMAPDMSNADGYEVYVSTNISSSPSTSDFTAANRIFATAAENSSWTTHGISLSAYAGQSIRLAFRNNSANKYQLWIDDILVSNINNSIDMVAAGGNTYQYSTLNTNNNISATFRNNGYTAVTSLVFNYQVGNNPVVSQTQSLLSPLQYLEYITFSFANLFSSPTPGYYPVKVWVSTINGQQDQLHANDTITSSLTLSGSIPIKKVVVEEFTSTKCAICPDGYTRLSTIVSTNTNVIATSIHSNDNLTNTTGTSLTTTYALQGSSAMIDRYNYSGAGNLTIGRNDWSTYITQRQAMVVPVGVSVNNVTYNQNTRQVSATVSADFVGDVKGDYRINLYVKENNIYGPIMDVSDNGWNQYSSLFNIQASPYYQIGYPFNSTTNILGPNQYSHQYVINEFLDGSNGAAGIIPVNGNTAGQSYSKAYTYTLPVAATGEYRYNPDNVYLVGLVTEYSTGTILNAFEVKLISGPEAPVGIAQLTKETTSVSVYPNPASGYCYFSFTSSQSQEVKLQVYSTLGVLVYETSEQVSQGNTIQQMDCSALAEGNYHVVLNFKDHVVSKKLTVIK